MNVHPQHHPSYYKAKSLLRRLRNKESAVSGLVTEDKLITNDAYELIEFAYKGNISRGRTSAGLYMIGAALASAIFLLILYYTGRLYYIILPMVLFAFFKSLYEFITTNGYDG